MRSIDLGEVLQADMERAGDTIKFAQVSEAVIALRLIDRAVAEGLDPAWYVRRRLEELRG